MKAKKVDNIRYSGYLFRWSEDEKNLKAYSERLLKKSNRIKDCLNLWSWDVYEKNKLMDLRSVNRCNDNRICPNCRKLDLSRCIHNFQTPFNYLLSSGHVPYLLTLTLPNCDGAGLKDTIDFLNKSFRRFFHGFNLYDKDMIKFRQIHFSAAFKVLEITYNKTTKTYHPHLHCIIFSDDEYRPPDFAKVKKGHYSFKRKCYNFHSDIDIHIMKIWTMIINKIRITYKNYELMVNDPTKLLQADIKELDEKGIYEVLKYTFKDSDISNYDVFKTIVAALDHKRIRQGYGLLYNLKCEDVDEGDLQDLESYLTIKEEPSQLLVRELNELVTTYKEYRKISRYTPNEYNNIID